MSFAKYFRSRILLESPEFVADKYLRDNYNFEFFLGDANGALIVPNIPGRFASHSDILRYLMKNNYIDKKTYDLKNMSKFKFPVVGAPTTIDMNYSGIILPKQKDTNGTYISFWTDRAYEAMKKTLLQYSKDNFQKPFYYEVASLDDIGNRSSVIPVQKED